MFKVAQTCGYQKEGYAPIISSANEYRITSAYTDDVTDVGCGGG